MQDSFENILLNGNTDELNELKRFLFEENIRISLKQRELQDLHEKFLSERIQFQEEMKQINLRAVTERKRLRDEETFFDKKMEILKNGFAQLDADKKHLEAEKRAFRQEQTAAGFSKAKNSDVIVDGGMLFAGVSNPLALKKRYRDLLKIYHPDNLCGDTAMVTLINKEYERLRKEMDYPFRNVN